MPPVQGYIRVVDGNYIQVISEGSVNISPTPCLSFALYVPQPAHDRVSFSSSTRSHNCSITFNFQV